jgi:hypothetical protein
MKKIAIWALAAFALLAVSCDKDNTSGEGDVNLTASALVGTWTITGDDFSDKWIFTTNTLTKDMVWHKTEGTYTVENGTIAYNITKAWNKDGDDWVERLLEEYEKVTMYIQAKLIYDGSVLIFNYVVEENPDDPYQNEDTSYFLYKVGGTISPDTKPLQGTWNWYMHGSDKSYIRSRVVFNGNEFEFIITPWSLRYIGTYTYRNGWITCNISVIYSGRNPEGEGFGEGGIDPTTLEGTWYELLKPEDAPFFDGLSFPFVADGEFAYSILANLPAKYEKQ